MLKTGAMALAAGAAPKAFRAPALKRKGAPLAMEEINAKGGIGSNHVELIFRDEALKVDVGVKNARYFADE